MIIGMNALVPATMYSGLIQHDVPAQIAKQIAGAPPVGYLFAAFLGYNPLGSLIPPAILHALPADQVATITSRAFFPQLIDAAFHRGLTQVLIFSIVVCVIAAGVSWLRGGKYIHHDESEQEPPKG
jgi:hypothetical protein